MFGLRVQDRQSKANRYSRGHPMSMLVLVRRAMTYKPHCRSSYSPRNVSMLSIAYDCKPSFFLFFSCVAPLLFGVSSCSRLVDNLTTRSSGFARDTHAASCGVNEAVDAECDEGEDDEEDDDDNGDGVVGLHGCGGGGEGTGVAWVSRERSSRGLECGESRRPTRFESR